MSHKNKVLLAILFGGICIVLLSFLFDKDKSESAIVSDFISKSQRHSKGFFTDKKNEVLTPEIMAFEGQNAALVTTFSQNRIKTIMDKQAEVSSGINRNWLGITKSDADKTKAEQADFLNGLLSNEYKGGGESENELSILNFLKDKGALKTHFNSDKKTGTEIIPTITAKGNDLITVETPYYVNLPYASSRSLIFNKEDNKDETKLTINPENIVDPKIYDNKALYANIKNATDELISTNPEGIDIAIIIKDKSALDQDGKLILNYELIMPNLIAEKDQNAIIFKNKDNRNQFVLTPPNMIDTTKKTPGEVNFILNDPNNKEKPETEIIPLTFINKLKEFFSFETKKASAEEPVPQNVKLQLEAKISPEATYPLLITYDLLPVLTKYITPEELKK